MCSGCTSLPSAGQTSFCLSGIWSWSCRLRKAIRFSRTAVKSFTGIVTSPKLIEPVQTGREEVARGDAAEDVVLDVSAGM